MRIWHRVDRTAAYRETVQRHHRRQLARGWFPEGTSCIDWLLALDPFRQAVDAQHYLDAHSLRWAMARPR